MPISHASRAHCWANELKHLSEDDLHMRVSDRINILLRDGDTYTAFRTMSTFILGHQLKIKLRKLWIYDMFMSELDRVISQCVHDNSMFVPYETVSESSLT